MTWTYSGNPGSSDRDQVRFRLQDTDTNNQLLSDEEILYLTTTYNPVILAAAKGARIIEARFTRLADMTTGRVSVSYQSRAQTWRTMAQRLEREAQAVTALPYAGGISQADIDSVESNDDRVVPAFEIGMHDYDSNQSSDDDG